MTDECRGFEREGATVGREQEVADRALRGLLAGAPRPVLPPSFAQRCASRVRFAPPAAPLAARQRLVLRTYWILAAIAAAGVLARVAWLFRAGSSGGSHVLDSLAAFSPAITAGAAVTLAAILTPILVLVYLRGGLIALTRRMLGVTFG